MCDAHRAPLQNLPRSNSLLSFRPKACPATCRSWGFLGTANEPPLSPVNASTSFGNKMRDVAVLHGSVMSIEVSRHSGSLFSEHWLPIFPRCREQNGCGL